MHDRLGRRFGVGRVVRGLGAMGVVTVLGSGCLFTEVNLDFCSNINGDELCAQRHDGEHLFCLYGSDACLAELPPEQLHDPGFDGCVEEQPAAECYSPCGGGQSQEDDGSCSWGADGTSSDDGTSTEPAPVCGNGEREDGEACDGVDLGGETCRSRGFDDGELGCNETCSFDVAECISWSCGNNIREGGEACDGSDLSGRTCQTFGFDGGTLVCGGGCSSFDVSGCTSCGNGTKELGETCDGTDLDGETCVSLGFSGGILACTSGCFGFDDSSCTDCGNGVAEPGEVCDGTDFDGLTCVAYGFAGGQLACVGCSSINVSGCV